MRLSLQYCLFFFYYFSLAAYWPRKPIPKASDFWLDRINHDISAIYTLSFFLKRRSYMKMKQVLCCWNCHASLLPLPLPPGHHDPLPATQLDTHPSHTSCHQNAVCHLVLGMHMCGEQCGLDCAASWNHTTRPCPSSAIPSGKGGNERHCMLATRDS